MISLYDLDQLIWFHTDIGINMNHSVLYILYTVKSAHAVTSIKQTPVLKGHIFINVWRKSIFDIYFTEFGAAFDNCFTCFVQVLLYILL
jgi:hypothetical protein